MAIRKEICCIGHITLDKISTPAGSNKIPGGTAYYFSHGMANLDVDYLLVTALADAEMAAVEELQRRNISVQRLTSAHTVLFENYYSQNQDERWQKVRQQADPFSVSDVAEIEAAFFHLGPLLATDIPDEIVVTLASKGQVSLDVQGFLRSVENEQVVPVDWKAKKELLPLVHFLKASEEEMQVLTGTASVEEGAKMLAAWGAKEIIITLGSKGSVIYDRENFFHIPAYKPKTSVDATGCGDTYMAGYLAQRVKGTGIQHAGEFAAAMATLKLATSGPFTGTKEEVNAILQKQQLLH